MHRYLVTGGAGFIGSMLVRLLLERTGKVVVLDNLASGKEANLREIASGVDLRVADIRSFDQIQSHFRDITHVFHLAAIPSVPRSITEPVPSHEANIDGTFNVLRACHEAHVRHVVYAASSSAYGETEVLPKVESMTPDPLSPYAVQKLVGEYYMRVFATCFAMETVSLRFFNVYGPRQDPSSPYSGVLSIFMSCLLDRKAPTIFGDGEQSRDFTYVEDVAALCVKASEAPGVAGRVYNAGNGGRYTLNRVWQELCRMEGVSIQPNYSPPRPGDVRHSQADTTAAMRELGHAPRVTLEQGLARTLEWYRQSLKPA